MSEPQVVACPKCGGAAYLFDWGTRCTRCGKDTMKGEDSSDVPVFPTVPTNYEPQAPPRQLPQAVTSPQQETQPFSIRDSGKPSRPTFRPRAYPAMRIIQMIYYVLAGLFVLFGIVLLIFGVSMNVLGALPPASLVVIFVGVPVCLAFPIVSMMFAAECIKIMIDIQRNTQETAHYTKFR